MEGSMTVTWIFTLTKRLLALTFYLLFIWYSFMSIKEFVQGKVIHNLMPSKAKNLKFPEVTLCPRQGRSLAYLKTIALQEDLKLTSDVVTTFRIFDIISQNPDILDKYSFKKEEVFKQMSFL